MKKNKYLEIQLSKITGKLLKLIYENAGRDTFIYNKNVYIPSINMNSNKKVFSELKSVLTINGYENSRKYINTDNIDLEKAKNDFNIYIKNNKKKLKTIFEIEKIKKQYQTKIKQNPIEFLNVMKKKKFFLNKEEIKIKDIFVKKVEKHIKFKKENIKIEKENNNILLKIEKEGINIYKDLESEKKKNFDKWIKREAQNINKIIKDKKEIDDNLTKKIKVIIKVIDANENTFNNILNQKILKKYTFQSELSKESIDIKIEKENNNILLKIEKEGINIYKDLESEKKKNFDKWIKREAQNINKIIKDKKEIDNNLTKKIKVIIKVIDTNENTFNNILNQKILKRFENKDIFDFYKKHNKEGTFRSAMLTKIEKERLLNTSEIIFKKLFNKLKNQKKLSKQEEEDLIYAAKIKKIRHEQLINKKDFETIYNYIPEMKNIMLDIMQIQNTEKQKNKMKEIRLSLQNINNEYRNGWIASIDLEFKRNNRGIKIYEIGYTLKNIKKKKLIVKNFIIKENYKHSYKPFNRGLSEHVNIKEAINELNKDFLRLKREGGIITGNSIGFDLQEIEKIGGKINTDKIIDLNDMLTFIDKNNKNISLQKILDLTNIEYINLHNAANDSYYSVRAFVKLYMKYKSNNNTNFIKNSIKTKIITEKNNKKNEKKEIIYTTKKMKMIEQLIKTQFQPITKDMKSLYKEEMCDTQTLFETIYKNIKKTYHTFTYKDLFELIEKDIKNLQLIIISEKIIYINIKNAAYLIKNIKEKIPNIDIDIKEIFKNITTININKFSIIKTAEEAKRRILGKDENYNISEKQTQSVKKNISR